ncbi:MAG: nucleotide exchange factor GrpE, partial [Candidatus Kapaibacterium sp.]
MNKREIPIDDSQDNTSSQREAATDQTQDVDRVAELEAENARLRDHALRTMADFDNFRRRAQVEREQTVQYANERLLRSLLPIIDDFHR